MLNQWEKQLNKLSGNLTTNGKMPSHIIKKLLDENESLKANLSFKNVKFPKLNNDLGQIEGLDILSGLQKLNKKDCLTLFRAVRFPTNKRIYEMVSKSGYAISNYEQERILDFYQNKNYIETRNKINRDYRFQTQPQERVVHGLPLFCLANDALQIHRAFRGNRDKTIIVAIYIPHQLFESKKVKLVSNTAIDFNYENKRRDFLIKDFYKENGFYEIDFKALRARGIDLHEMYTKDLPLDIQGAKKLGIDQEFFLLDIYETQNDKKIKALFENTKILKQNDYFLHGFFGDQNIFGRRETTYLPYGCQKITKKVQSR